MRPRLATAAAGALRSAPRTVISVAIAAALLLAVAAAACGSSEAEPTPTPPLETPSPIPTPTATPSPTATPTPAAPAAGLLDGVRMQPQEFERRSGQRPVAVVIDNHPSAYPQSGLDTADLVFEGFVEGQVTRYLAIYWRQDSDHIEPVRSLRTPFAVWVSELQALLGHVGAANYQGEANATARIREWAIPHLDHDEPIGPPAFYRNPARFAPYNVITSTEALRQLAAERDILGEFDVLDSWEFKEPGEGTASRPPASVIDISYSGRQVAGTVVRWTWDSQRQRYLRFRSGAPHLDGQTGAQLAFTNVVVMTVEHRTVSPYGHVVMDLVGEGPATVFLDGKRIEGTWRKPSREERTRFYTAAGEEVAFNRGPTWIQAVSPASFVGVSE